MVTLEGQRCIAAEGSEDGPQRGYVLPQAWSGRLEVGGVAPLDMSAHLGAEPEAEPPPGGLREFPGLRRGDHRAAGKGHRHARCQVQPGRPDGCCCGAHQGASAGLGQHESREALALDR